MEKTNILIVDDDSINLLIMEKILKKLDLNIVKAGSGFEALELSQKIDFALVLMDAQMPEMDGFETAQKIRSMAKNKELPIIFVSAVSKTKRFIIKGYESGAVDYLLKPIDQFLLNSKVKIFCQLYEQKKLLENNNSELERLNQKLQQEVIKRTKAEEELLFQAIRDPLTGLFNRRYLEESLSREIAKSKRHKTPLGVIMIDADHFKAFNDTYGHLAGDNVLRNLGEVLLKYSRKEDIACRYGGEEFVLVLPGASEKVAGQRAEDLRLIFESKEKIEYENRLLPNVTISLGVAIVPNHGSNMDDILSAADDALYLAKEKGRNCVVNATTAEKKIRVNVTPPDNKKEHSSIPTPLSKISK